LSDLVGKVKRIKAGQLKVGMYIAEFSDEWAADSHLRAEGLVTRSETVQRVQGTGVADVYIDTSKGIDCSGSVPIEEIQKKHEQELKSVQSSPIAEPLVAFEEERVSALAIRENALSLVTDVMQDVKMGRSFDTAAVDVIADEIITSVMNNQSALSSLMRMRDKDQYLLEHSMNVAVLMGVLARSMGFRDKQLHELVFGAFVHDVGKVRVPEEVLYKPGRLEAEEWSEMKRHVDYGIEALAAIPGIPAVAHDICAQHHERLDASGYPFSLPESKISTHGRMASVVDVYDAVTADRCYHEGMAPTLALKKMLEWSGDHLDRNLVYQLIRCISVYPAGALVELSSGYLAVVQEVNALQPSRPSVKLIYSLRRKAALPAPQLVNLAAGDQFGAIKRAVEPEPFNITLRDFL